MAIYHQIPIQMKPDEAWRFLGFFFIFLRTSRTAVLVRLKMGGVAGDVQKAGIVAKHSEGISNKKRKQPMKYTTSWWLNQAIWKKCWSNRIIFPKTRDENLKIFELPPPRLRCA